MSEEVDFWNSIRPHVPGHAQRLENVSGTGVPDVLVCWEQKTVLLELKVWIDGVGFLLRKEQYAWGRRHAQEGGKVFVICRHSAGVATYLYPFFEVEPYGKSSKYVKIVMSNSHTSDLDLPAFKKSLKTILFT